MTVRGSVLSLGLLLGCSGGDPGVEPGEAPGAAPQGPSGRAQVSIFWGGGQQRDWDGEITLGARAEVDWVWLTDFEDGDLCLPGALVAAPDQKVPPGWSPAGRADLRREIDGPPAKGFALQTRTEDEADGICFEVRANSATQLTVDFGVRARLQVSLARVLSGPVSLPADDEGNVILIQAVNLARQAPFAARHQGVEAQRVSLHTHSCFSTNEIALAPLIESMRPFVRTVWWTDHNQANPRMIIGGDFEQRALVEQFWQTGTESAEIVSAGVVAGDVAAGEGAYRLEARGGAERGGHAWIDVGRGAGQLNTPLAARPLLRWSWRPLSSTDASTTVAFALVQFSSGRRLRYLSGAIPDPGPRDVVLEADAGAWQSIERDVAWDLRERGWGSRTDGLRRVQFGVLCPAGGTGAALFDEVALTTPSPADLMRTQAELLGTFDGFRSYLGLERTAWIGPAGFGVFYPHLTALVPRGAPELFGALDHAPTALDQRSFADSVHEAGGLVGAHHLQMDAHYEALMEGGGLGVDLFEIGAGWWHVPAYATEAERAARDACGYPALTEDEVYPLLVRWDRMTARGLFLTGYGAPDLHGLFERSKEGWLNRWLSWIHTPGESPEELLAALGRGQVTASEWRSGAKLTLTVEGRPWMGKVVATDRGRHQVEANVSGAIPGSRLRWIRGILARDRADAQGGDPGEVGLAGWERVESAEHVARLEVDTARGIFVRAELLNPAGHLVALSNPVVFTPYWPSRWQVGRVAFDWGGASLAAEDGLSLDGAWLASDGELSLKGAVAEPGGELTIRTEGADGEDLQRLSLPPGPFSSSVALTALGSPAPTADPLSLPQRKERALVIDVGAPGSIEEWELEGFAEWYRGPLLMGGIEDSYGVVARSPVSFRAPVPVGERSWLKLRSHGFSRASGRVLMDGAQLGSFERMSAKTIVIEPLSPGQSGEQERVFSIVLDSSEVAPALADRLLLTTIELWRGEGVVDY